MRCCRALAALLLGATLVGCASGPRRGGDGPGANPPANVASLPDAEPRIEAIKPGGANKPYQVLGHDYVPMTRDVPFSERGLASWYGRQFDGRRTASGETYDMYAMTAAHPTLPIPSYARIRNPANGREIVVRINDRGPFHAGRIVDLSYAAAARLDLLRGVAPVELDRITFDEIRAGTWRHDGGDATRLAAARSARPPPVEAASTGPAVPSVPIAPVVAVAPAPLELAAVAAQPAEVQVGPSPGDAATSGIATVPSAAAPRGFWVQLGAFREASGADSFQRRVAADFDWLAPRLATFSDTAFYRVQAGPYASREEAQGAAARVREALGLVPMIVERR
jgi:peptidoglycan lytic transglycosylase